jgi:hypothetical protein
LTVSLPICIPFITPSCLIVLARSKQKIVRKKGIIEADFTTCGQKAGP